MRTYRYWLTGVIALLLLALSAASVIAQSAAVPIAFGDRLDAVLSASQPEALFTFEARAGDAIRIGVSSSTGLDTYVTLEDAGGLALVFNDDGGESLDALINGYVIPLDGSYLIRATSYSFAITGRADEGSITVSLDRVTAQTIAPGVPFKGEDAALASLFTFAGSTGDVVHIAMTADMGFPEVQLMDPEGLVLGGGYRLTYLDDGGTIAYVGPLELPATGTYSITLGGTGAFTLALDLVEALPLAFNEPQTLSVSAESPRAFAAFNVVDSQNLIRFDGSADTPLRVWIIGGDGTSVMEREVEAGVPFTVDQISTYQTGTHYVIAEALDPEIPGSLTLTLSAAETPSLDDGVVTVDMGEDDTDTQRRMVFTAEADQSYRITVTLLGSEEFASPSFEINQADFSYFSSLSFSGNFASVSAVFTVPQSGLVTVTVYAYGLFNAQISVTPVE